MSRCNGADLKIHLFGRFEVYRSGALIRAPLWPQNKTQSLLKLLSSERGRVFTQDQLLDALYPELDPEKAVSSLYGRLSELRRLLEPSLKKGRASQFIQNVGQQGYSFNAEAPCWIDVEAFERWLEAAQIALDAQRWTEALQPLEHALGLYRGDFLSEDLYEEWTIAPREQWKEKCLVTLARSAECYAQLGQYDRALETCRRALELKPSEEGIYRQKMLYHCQLGEQTKAIETYRACVGALSAHLDAEPSPQTRELYEIVYRQEVAPMARAVPHNLPQELTSFVGRAAQIAEIKELLGTTRLLTLTGVGGAGKTRLSLRIASEVLEAYCDGVWLIELAGLVDAAVVPQAVASVLGVREQPGRSVLTALTEFLKSKQLLLVLDNCEHVVSACAVLTQEILRACPELRVLATSREILGIAGETVWHVPPLSNPELDRLPEELCGLKQYEAVRLFVERARASCPTFSLTRENATAAVQVCHQLDGIPLAIELAAARVKVLSVEQIAVRLDDRFRLLTGGNRAALPRQQTLLAAMDWSYQLLCEPEQRLLRRLAIFAGGWTLEEAERVCAEEGIAQSEILDLLTRLVDKSLVVVETQSADLRYRLLETVRQYAVEKLRESGEAERVSERHALCFLALAERAESELVGPKQKQWLDRLEREHDNLHVALAGCQKASGLLEMGLRLAGALSPFWEARGYLSEGRAQLVELVECAPANPERVARARALNEAGRLAELQGDSGPGRRWVYEALAIARHLGAKEQVARSRHILGTMSYGQGDYSEARSLYEESLALYRELRRKSGVAHVLYDIGIVSHSQGDYDGALVFYEESLTINRELGNKLAISRLLNGLGNIAFPQGDCAKAQALYEESLAIKRDLGDKSGIASVLNNLGEIAMSLGEYVKARALYAESLTILREIGNKSAIAALLHNLGYLSFCEEDYGSARRLLEQGLEMRQIVGSKQGMATSLLSLGELALAQADYETAQQCFAKSLEKRYELKNKWGIAETLKSFAGLAIARSQYENAARLLGASDALHDAVVRGMSPLERADYEQNLSILQKHLGKEACDVLWAQGRAMTLRQAVEYALNGSVEAGDALIPASR